MRSERQRDWATPDNPLVLQNRRVRDDVRLSTLSRLEDDTWDLTAGMLEDHATKTGINFKAFAEHWRPTVRRYLWLLINDERVRPVPGAKAGRLSLQTISLIKQPLALLLATLDDANVDDLASLDAHALDALAIFLNENLPYDVGRRVLTEIRRLWANRHLVEAPLRMPDAVPWHGDRAVDLLNMPSSGDESKTRRIADATLVPLIAWSSRFVSNFSDDIVQSLHQYRGLIQNEYRHRPESSLGKLSRHDYPVAERLQAALDQLRELGLGLPGKVAADGTRELLWVHLGRLARVQPQWAALYHADAVAASGLAVDDDAYLTVPCTGKLDDSPWRSKPLAWTEVIDYATLLQTACFLLIAYLSGMRPGEVLGLRRNCATFDATLGLWMVHGTRWKGARTDSGEKAPEGEERAEPWVIHPLAAEAIAVLQDMHDEDLLFPKTLRPKPLRGNKSERPERPGEARTSSQMGTDIGRFCEWVKEYASANNRPDLIPPDPHGRLNPRRLRRTLAWHIVRRPRGLVATAIQYGHVATIITQGYAGNRASGFPDELAFERWLERFEHISELHDYIEDGGIVSGPAATELRRRVSSAIGRFRGRVVPTNRLAEGLLRRPDLQIFRGEGVHCAFARATAQCVEGDDADAPEIGDCRSACVNIARTDDDIRVLEGMRAELTIDTLAPPIRYSRQRAVIARLDDAIDTHRRTES